MKRSTAILVAAALVGLLAWHFCVERRSSLIIFVDGLPATTALQPFASEAPPIMPDSDGRYELPSGMAQSFAYEFQSRPDHFWMLNFPDAGTKKIEIQGLDIRTTSTLRYFGIYLSKKIVDQVSAKSEEPVVN